METRGMVTVKGGGHTAPKSTAACLCPHYIDIH